MGKNEVRKVIEAGETALGIEFGSTRIKAVLVGKDNQPIASGSYEWENRLENGIWTYSQDHILSGLRSSYNELKKNVLEKYEITLKKIGAAGFSGMMHGYMAFDKEGELLVPFRTWRNTMTEEASGKLTDLFDYPVPQRWSVAHLLQAILNEEEHVSNIDFITTLSGYVHWMLSGQKVMGIGEASGMFPIDIKKKTYNQTMIEQFDNLISTRGFSWKVGDILPKVLVAGEKAGYITEEGAKLLDPEGDLEAGVVLCPPEGDAGTGMTATNSIEARTGNISAGTSIFAMIVLDKELSKVYSEIDLVTTPAGKLVAMVHCNNCTSDINAWMNIFREYSELMGMKVDMNQMYGALFNKALEGDADGGGLLSYCYLSGEHITGFEEGRPLLARTPDSKFNLANFMRVNLMTTLGAIRIGMDILLKQEAVEIETILGHGGLFKTPEVGQRIMAAAIGVPVSVMETAGEGGAWGIALLASFLINKKEDETFESFLQHEVFGNLEERKIHPDQNEVVGFERFMERYKKGMAIERAAIDFLR